MGIELNFVFSSQNKFIIRSLYFLSLNIYTDYFHVYLFRVYLSKIKINNVYYYYFILNYEINDKFTLAIDTINSKPLVITSC